MSNQSDRGVARKVLNNLLKGAVKSIPLFGSFLEQVIYGTLGDVAAEKEKAELHKALWEMGAKLDMAKGVDLGVLLDGLEKSGRFGPETLGEMRRIRALLKDPENAPVPKRAAEAVSRIPHVFISHSSNDKGFVRRLAGDLIKAGVGVWVDERELAVGDSIVEGISEGLKDSDYLIVVLSKASVRSKWVMAELNSALMDELSGKGTVIIPIVIDDCEIPALLKDRKYADFRADYGSALEAVVSVLNQEGKSADSVMLEQKGGLEGDEKRSGCVTLLGRLSMAELRRRLVKRLARREVGDLWFDTLEEGMDDHMPGRSINECAVELISQAKNRNKLGELLRNVCVARADIANP